MDTEQADLTLLISPGDRPQMQFHTKGKWYTVRSKGGAALSDSQYARVYEFLRDMSILRNSGHPLRKSDYDIDIDQRVIDWMSRGLH